MPNRRDCLSTLIENIFKTTIDNRGRIYIPRRVRERFSIKLGQRLFIKIENGHFSIYTVKEIDRS